MVPIATAIDWNCTQNALVHELHFHAAKTSGSNSLYAFFITWCAKARTGEWGVNMRIVN